MGSKRGQTAIELLVTYGWALVVLAVIIFALFAAGIFNMNSYPQQECIISSGFSCLSFFMESNGMLLVNMQQTTRSPINITAIGCDQNSMVTGINMLKFSAPSNQIFLPIGANFTLSLQCYNNQGTPFSGAVGSTFSGAIIINYTNDFTNAPGTALGSISSKISSQ